MITKRIIPCLDVKDGRVVKGVKFEGLSDVSSPTELAKYYSENGADELVFYDITASFEERKLFAEILTEVARQIFIPLTVGGGINTVEDFDRVLMLNLEQASMKQKQEDEIHSDDPFIKEIQAAIAARAQAKKEKNYAEADRIRKELSDRGVELVDTKDGTTFKLNK